ncbi:LysR family transcriptional regulator [Streptomyces thermocarboxydus]
MEQETGHRLVERGAKGVRLTPAGEILLSHTHAVLAQLERAEAELAAYGAEAGTVTVAAFATGIAQVVAPAVARLAASAPGIRIRVQDAEGDASLPMVLDRQVDVAVAVEYRGPRPPTTRASPTSPSTPSRSTRSSPSRTAWPTSPRCRSRSSPRTLDRPVPRQSLP